MMWLNTVEDSSFEEAGTTREVFKGWLDVTETMVAEKLVTIKELKGHWGTEERPVAQAAPVYADPAPLAPPVGVPAYPQAAPVAQMAYPTAQPAYPQAQPAYPQAAAAPQHYGANYPQAVAPSPYGIPQPSPYGVPMYGGPPQPVYGAQPQISVSVTTTNTMYGGYPGAQPMVYR